LSDLKYNYLDDYDRFTHRALFEFSDATTYSRIETQKFTFSRKQPLALLKKNNNINIQASIMESNNYAPYTIT
jgi:hypothetical protein